jgi:hypothetical protein
MKEARLTKLDRKIDLMTRFVKAQNVSKESIEEALQICANLLNEHEVEVCKRFFVITTVYTFLVRGSRSYEESRNLNLKKVKKKKLQFLHVLYKTLNMTMRTKFKEHRENKENHGNVF